jgi:ABC-2 type transport system ATP-binding protein
MTFVSDVRTDIAAIEVDDLSKTFGKRTALAGVSLSVASGQIHALLGPNGSGKTTLVRSLAGLLGATSGRVRILGRDVSDRDRSLRGEIGLVPSGDRTFYLRISGLENLVFFGRLQGLGYRAARERGLELLRDVGLSDAAKLPVGKYSHGMQKRLSVARALLTRPSILLIDEATHDLDPLGAKHIRELVGAAADKGAAVLWTTQRLEELRGFAQGVTVLSRGAVRFRGTVAELAAHAAQPNYIIRVRNGSSPQVELVTELQRMLGPLAQIAAASDGPDRYRLAMAQGAVVGDAIASLTAAGIRVIGCREERADIEEAFLAMTAEEKL